MLVEQKIDIADVRTTITGGMQECNIMHVLATNVACDGPTGRATSKASERTDDERIV